MANGQLALGAVGLTVATRAEAERMSGAGCEGVFWTRQPSGKNNSLRVVALRSKDGDAEMKLGQRVEIFTTNLDMTVAAQR